VLPLKMNLEKKKNLGYVFPDQFYHQFDEIAFDPIKDEDEKKREYEKKVHYYINVDGESDQNDNLRPHNESDPHFHFKEQVKIKKRRLDTDSENVSSEPVHGGMMLSDFLSKILQ